MNAHPHRETAKIYQFPQKVSSALARRRNQDKLSADLSMIHAPEIMFGGNWYHEAAVQDERTRKP